MAALIIVALLGVIALLLLPRKRTTVIVARPEPREVEPPPLSIDEMDWQADLASKHNEPPWPDR